MGGRRAGQVGARPRNSLCRVRGGAGGGGNGGWQGAGRSLGRAGGFWRPGDACDAGQRRGAGGRWAGRGSWCRRWMWDRPVLAELGALEPPWDTPRQPDARWKGPVHQRFLSGCERVRVVSLQGAGRADLPLGAAAPALALSSAAPWTPATQTLVWSPGPSSLCPDPSGSQWHAQRVPWAPLGLRSAAR